MKSTIRKYQWIWAWEDEREEAWLGEMAGKGYHLEALEFPGVYRFRLGAPTAVTYRLDYKASSNKDEQAYRQIFADAGWEHVGSMSGWQYFRKDVVAGEQAEIFTDVDLKIEKYRRLLTFMTSLFPIYIILFITMDTPDTRDPFRFTISILMLGIVVLFAFAIYKLWRRIETLRDI